jgi:hypothetical protein
MEIRVTYPSEPGKLTRVLKTFRRSGGQLYAHLVYRFYDSSSGFFVCEHPAEAALALEREGLAVETRKVLTVRTANRPGICECLVQTLEAESIEIAYSYAASTSEELFLVLLTNDNPKAEDVLRSFLLRPDPFYAEQLRRSDRDGEPAG